MAQSLELQYIDESYQKLVQISGSYIADGTGSTINNLTVTASYATNALTASYAVTAPSASYAISASHSENADSAISASHAVQADNASTADSATIATTAITAYTASYVAGANVDGTVANATSASYALTASFLLGFVTSASYAESSSHAVSASYAENANSSNTAISASWADVAGYAQSVSGSNVVGPVTNSTYADNTIVNGKNVSGGTIEKGTPLYFTGSGTSGNLVGVWPADASNALRMPAAGIAGEQMIAGAEGTVLLDGFINGVDTSAFNSGDTIYVADGGGYTNQRPTGSTIKVQAIGYVEKVDSTNGSGVIQGSGRANDVPNIAEGYLWVGNGDGVATATDSSSITTFAGLTNFDTISYDNSGSLTATRTNGGSLNISINSVPNAVSSSHSVSSSLSQLAVNLTSGDKDHSGTIDQQFSAPNNWNQKNLATISGVTYNGDNYPISELTYMNYANFGPQFTNALGFSQWDSFSYNFGAELLLAPQRIQFNFTPSGSVPVTNDTTGLMGMQANGANSQGLFYATELQIGQYKGVTIGIGNRSGVSWRQTENLNINAVTSSLTTDYNYESATVGHFATGGSRGNVTTITNGGGSGTTLNLNGGNFYTLDLTSNSTTLNLNTGDIVSSYGQTFSILVDNSTTSNTLSFDSNFKFPGGTAPTISPNGTDILTGIVFGNNNVYITQVQNLS